MVTKKQRLLFVNNLLNALGQLRPLVSSARNERVFEIYCYLRKADELIRRGKVPLLQNVRRRTFKPHSKPGDPRNASYISLQEIGGETFDLFLNGKFPGRSGVEHSPDIVLIGQNSGRIASIYECKNHSGRLGLSNYREFIGYLEEMKIPKRRHGFTLRNFYPEMKPCIYTSATAVLSHSRIQEQYNFSVADRL